MPYRISEHRKDRVAMKTMICALAISAVAIAPLPASAGRLDATIAGGAVGGVAGSVYASGAAATASSIGTAASGAAAAVPGLAASAATAIAATSTPVLVGVAAGGLAAYLLYSLTH